MRQLTSSGLANVNITLLVLHVTNRAEQDSKHALNLNLAGPA